MTGDKKKKKKQKDEKGKSNLGISIKAILIILVLTAIPVLFYNPNLSFGPLDVARQDFFKTEILLSGNSYSTTGLVKAIRANDMKTVKLFVRSGFDLNNIADSGISPICIAAETGNFAVFSAMMQGDVNLVLRNFSNGLTPIYCAIKGNNIQVVDKIVKSGIGLNFRTDLVGGISPLHYAAALGLDNMVSYLTSAGADVNITDVNGQTPLHKAVNQDNIVVLYILLNAGADVDLEDNYGKTALDMAKDSKNDVYVALLKRFSKKP